MMLFISSSRLRVKIMIEAISHVTFLPLHLVICRKMEEVKIKTNLKLIQTERQRVSVGGLLGVISESVKQPCKQAIEPT